MKGKKIVISLVLLALAATACQPAAKPVPTAVPPSGERIDGSAGTVAEGNIVPRDYTRLFFRASGTLSEVLVAEGDHLAAGDAIARLSEKNQAGAALAAAELEVEQAQQALDDLERTAGVQLADAKQVLVNSELALIDAQEALDDLDTDTFQDQLDDDHQAVIDAQDDLDQKQEDFEQYKDLDEDNQTRKDAEQAVEDAQDALDEATRKRDRKQNELDAAQALVAQAQAAVDEARYQVQQWSDGPDPRERALAEARLASANAQIASAQELLDDLTLLAPFAGTVVEVMAAAGEPVMSNQAVALLADLDTLYVETTDLSELDVVDISQGQKATISPDALPELELPATVTLIQQQSGTKGGDVVYTVRLQLDKTDPRLRWGMTVQVAFE
ncbi:MAG: HlyD family efflux transporter periplasmic adaptor subunit [Anaerolineae bacterium]|nr:HlyD family efflux transporter periplasmic adaptor subunit [Anaerolineae bacterium]